MRISSLLAIVLCIVVFMVGTGIIVVRRLSRDEPPPNVADLAVVRLDLPDEQNAFTYFEKAAAAMDLPNLDRHDRLHGMLTGEEEFDGTLVNEFLSANEEGFGLWEEGLAIGVCQAPEVASFSDEMPYLARWRNIARCAEIRALNDMREGREQQAFERAMDIVRFGGMLEETGGPVISYLVARAVKTIGIETTQELLAGTTLGAGQLGPLVERLGACESNRQALADAYRVEYHACSNTVDELATGKGSSKGVPVKKRVPGYLFKPNQTHRIFAEYFRWQIANALAPRWTWKAEPPEDVQWILDSDEEAMRRSRWKPNIVGHSLFALLVPALDRVNEEACRLDWRVRAAKTTVALRCFELDRGELPDRLEALVPDYLKEVPLDPFDGQPLRYSREERMIRAFDEQYMKDNGLPASIEIPFVAGAEEQAAPDGPVQPTGGP